MKDTTFRLLTSAILSFMMYGSAVAQELIILDAQTPRQVVTAYTQDQTINLQHLKKGETYSFIVPPDMALGACRPDVSLVESTAQLIDLNKQEHLLRFKATASIAQLKLQYPCTWDATNPPRHYISIGCQSCETKKTENGLADFSVLEVENAAAAALINDVLIGGNCLDVQNVTTTGGADKIGKFSNGLSNIGFNSGMILCTGNIDAAPGPNDNNGFGGGGTLSVDNDLGAITTGTLFDMATVEFDFTPTQTPFTFQYAFASEEYCEYVNTSFNDVFGFFISGPGITGTQNLAVIPQTNTPISINTINHITNSGYYNANTPVGLDNCESGGVCQCLPAQTPASGPAVFEMQYDGFTKKMIGSTQVIPCSTYHVKIAIADVGDGLRDSGVFLKAGSFGGSSNASVEWIVNGQANRDTVVEGCGQVRILVDRGGSSPASPLPVSFSIAGTATSGADYAAIPFTIVIPAGQDQVLYTVNIADDMIPEGAETIILTLNSPCSCLHPQQTLTILDYVPMVLSADTISICGPSGTGTIGVAVQGGVAPFAYQWSVTGNGPTITRFVNQNTDFTVTVTDACGRTMTAVARINLRPAPTAQFVPPAPQICPGSQAAILISFTGVAPWVFDYMFNGTPQPPIQGVTHSPYVLFVDQPGLYQIPIVVDSFGCQGQGIGAIVVTFSTLSLTGVVTDATGSSLPDGAINTTVTGGTGPYNYTWQGPGSPGNIPDPVNLLPGNYDVTVTDGFGCTRAESFSVGPIQAPWTFDTTGTNHTIILPANLVSDIEGAALQTGDYIGVFFDSSGILKCGGYGIWAGTNSAFAAYGNDAVFPAKNGFDPGEAFKIKIWRTNGNLPNEIDATAEYAAIGSLSGLVTQTDAFAADGISMITAINAGTTHVIPLSSGWNMISSYVKPAQPDMLDVFGSIASSIDLVKDVDGNTCIPSIPINQIGDWDLLKGYQVKTNQKDTLLVVGQKLTPAANPIPLHPGWQIISYLRDNPQNIATVFAPIQGQISLVKNNEGQAYLPQFNINGIGDMKPGQGYKVKALSNINLVYPANFTGTTEERGENPAENGLTHFVLDNGLNTGNNATIILTDSIAGTLISDGDEIGVFTPAGVLCGAARYQQGAHLAVTVWGDDTSTDTLFEGMQAGEAYNFKVWNTTEQQEYAVQTTLSGGINAYEPDAIERITGMQMNTVGIETLTTVGVQTLELFPNPASGSLTIGISSDKPGKVALTLLRLDGTRALDSEAMEYRVGNTTYHLQLPAKLPSGMYWLRFQFENGMVYRPVFLQK